MLLKLERSTYHGAVAEVSGGKHDFSSTLFGMLGSGE
jgi:hypothetical protein